MHQFSEVQEECEKRLRASLPRIAAAMNAVHGEGTVGLVHDTNGKLLGIAFSRDFVSTPETRAEIEMLLGADSGVIQ